MRLRFFLLAMLPMPALSGCDSGEAERRKLLAFRERTWPIQAFNYTPSAIAELEPPLECLD
ncbi:hypothetical protein [Pseudoduganella lurida]|uniref:hypothetical protein n=1 Tax=Pseudoduganella lurida TaxID=1036180 RepID=UPI0011AA37F9|nr:hypothetical protein [Pseudoduganella lurida]